MSICQLFFSLLQRLYQIHLEEQMNTHGNNWGGSPNSLETDDGELARLKRENTKLKKSINAISANYEELRKERIALEELKIDYANLSLNTLGSIATKLR